MGTLELRNDIAIRAANSHDAGHLCEILNRIICAGGSTALETSLSTLELDDHYISGPECFFCFIAEASTGEAVGFQTVVRNAVLDEGWGDIGTFVKQEPRIRGVGAALFAHTVKAARCLGIAAINATIRADNISGLYFYEKLGFRSYRVVRGVPLKDGTPVDRLYASYSIT